MEHELITCKNHKLQIWRDQKQGFRGPRAGPWPSRGRPSPAPASASRWPTTNFERSELTRRDRLRCHLLLPVPRTRLKENSETTKNVCCFSPKTCQNKMQKCGTHVRLAGPRATRSASRSRRGCRRARCSCAAGPPNRFASWAVFASSLRTRSEERRGPRRGRERLLFSAYLPSLHTFFLPLVSSQI